MASEVPQDQEKGGGSSSVLCVDGETKLAKS